MDTEPTFKLAYALLTYEQNLGGRDCERLTVETQDDGAGAYLQLKTEQWSLDSPQELADLLADFLRRLPEVEADTLGAWPPSSRPAPAAATNFTLPTVPANEQPPF